MSNSVPMPRTSKKKDPVLETLEPQVRLKQLIDYSNQVEVGAHIPPLRYYRSGQEMIRMANVYFNEGNLENAYVLYLKFMTLFLEKIRKHPEFKTVSVELKAKNQATLREVLPRAEKIKQLLLEQYTLDYKKCLAERKKVEQEQKIKEEEMAKGKKSDKPKTSDQKPTRFEYQPAVIKFPTLDNVVYPDEEAPSAPPPTSLFSDASRTPMVDRSSKPMVGFSTASAFESHALRPVIVPVQVTTLFQAMAQSNTFKNIETCGILAGKLEKNELIITHMILPKQKGTSDSCQTMNEEEIFDYQDQNNLITIGWIHTHPTQTVFLSSVDLHTHCPYQLLMPEAIAIVISPKYNETGIFVLTPNHGLKFIANCQQAGFHPHPIDPPLYTEADHVRLDNKAQLEVLDLRS